MAAIDLAALNQATPEQFHAALADVVEHAPWVADALLARRPFPSLRDMWSVLQRAVREAPHEHRLALVRGHPDLAGKPARAGQVTADSAAEQAGAGLDQLSARDFAEFHRLNDAYRARFGFPFVICVRRHGRESILAEFARRLGQEPEAELRMALDEVLRIAALRLDQRVTASDRLAVHGRLSTHVLDTRIGRPAAGVPVALVELWQGGERELARAMTNADGRTDRPLIADRPVSIARYELRFRLAAYFAGSGAPLAAPPFLDLVPIRFAVAEPEGNYHVPLLVTPWSYATYRGS